MTRGASLIAALCVALAACARRPPDADATPETARTLRLAQPESDSLACGEKDCIDWWVLDIPEKGTLSVDLATNSGGVADAPVTLTLFDHVGVMLAHEQASAGRSIALRSPVAAARYFLSIASDSQKAHVTYTLNARSAAPPPVVKETPRPPPKRRPPPPLAPRFETKRASVLEISDHGHAVLLDLGETQGIRVGQRGRLLVGGRTAGSLEIVEVYPEGSLARVSGASGEIGANSAAEIDVPLGGEHR